MWFLSIENGCHFWNLEQFLGRNFALHSRTTQGMCMQSMIGISVTLMMLDPVQKFKHKFWILQWQLQMYQKNIGSTLNVRPNNDCDVVNVASVMEYLNVL